MVDYNTDDDKVPVDYEEAERAERSLRVLFEEMKTPKMDEDTSFALDDLVITSILRMREEALEQEDSETTPHP
ncbi:MAG: hypothetical protein GC137_09400 [Alphaproteobacteria bacterium]|nr:hypothetical protein [Alphaproteobacteria bacterium]